MLKVCSVCGGIKPLGEFQVRRASSDGRAPSCKDCRQAYDRERASQPHRVAVRDRVRAERNADPIKRKIDIQKRREWIARNRLKRQAHILVGNAIAQGKLSPPAACEECREASNLLHAHHEDYAQPFDVVWLCPPCHGYRHQQINDELRAVERMAA